VLAHEIGHLFGQDHETDGLMAEALTPATRTDPPSDPNPVDVAPLDQAFAHGEASLAIRSERHRSKPVWARRTMPMPPRAISPSMR
jgi:hypothetical protein